ncbi:uncharacterized protein [Argopecten irradians]|uniref:uncharacterized protein n=1 Tax=Argopecten irradians TaxID=31199 RepID=UPI003711D692
MEDDQEKDEEVGKTDQKSDVDVIRNALLLMFCECSGKEVPLTAVESGVKDCLAGKEINLQISSLRSIVQETFPTIEYTAEKREGKEISLFKNLSKAKDDERGACGTQKDTREITKEKNSQELMAHPIPSKPLDSFSEDDLCRILEPKFLQSGITLDVLEMFKIHEINGHVFKHFEIADLSNIVDMPYGKKKAIMIIKDELIKEEDAVQNIEKPSACTPEHNEDTRITVKETLRRFNTPSNVTSSYRKSALVSTDHTRIHDLIHPVHLFVEYDDDSHKETWITKKIVQFASACMNDRTNGTIHFGIRALTDDSQWNGEIVGISIDREKCNTAIKQCIRYYFFEDQIEIAWKCIRPPHFIRVVESDKNPPCCVVEIDVEPHAALTDDEAFFCILNSVT